MRTETRKPIACRFAGLFCQWQPVTEEPLRELYNVQCQKCKTLSDKWGVQ